MKQILILISIMAVGCATDPAEPGTETTAQVLSNDVEVTPQVIESLFGPITNTNGCQVVESCGLDGRCDMFSNCCWTLGETRCCQACVNDVCRPLQCGPAGPTAPNNPPSEPLAPVEAAAESCDEDLRAVLGDDYAKTTSDACVTTTICGEGPCVTIKNCCYTVGETRCCQACFDGQCRAMQCGPAGPTAPNNPPSDPLSPELATSDALTLTGTEIKASSDEAAEAMDMLSAFTPITDRTYCQLHPDGAVGCCDIHPGGQTACCCKSSPNPICVCGPIVISPNNPPSAPIAPEEPAVAPEESACTGDKCDLQEAAQSAVNSIDPEIMALFTGGATTNDLEEGDFCSPWGGGGTRCCVWRGPSMCCCYSVGGCYCNTLEPSPNNPPVDP